MAEYPTINNFRSVRPNFSFGINFGNRNNPTEQYPTINNFRSVPPNFSFGINFNQSNERMIRDAARSVRDAARRDAESIDWSNPTAIYGEKEDIIEDLNNIDWGEIPTIDVKSVTKLPNKKRKEIANTALIPERFTMVTDDDIHDAIKDRMPQKTIKSNTWGNNAWESWRQWRNSKPASSSVNEIPPIRSCSPQELGYWLERFVFEVRKQNGEEYPYKSLYELCCAIQRVYNDCSDGIFRTPVDIFQTKNENFFRFYAALDSKMGNLQSRGIGIKTKQADIITDDDENTLWETKVIGIDSARGLSNGVYFYNNTCFAMRSGDEHRKLCTDQYSFKHEGEHEKLIFTGRLNKNNQGGLKQRKYVPKHGEVFAKPGNPRCVVNLFKAYLNLIPQPGSFYKRPLDSANSINFSAQNIGENKLDTYMRSMFTQAGIDIKERHITGHSGKRTLCSKLYNAGFDEHMVKLHSGHRSDAVRAYEIPDANKRKQASDILTPK